jgi:excisionase family DNA binding protein
MTTTLYRIYGEASALLYVGITDNYDSRMRQHSEKAWWSDVRRIDALDFTERAEASSAEKLAIQTEGPLHNKVHSIAPAKSRYIPKRTAPGRATRRWLSQQEAAEYLGVTDRTIRNYVARGLVPAHRIRGSRLIRFDINELDAALRPIPSAVI